jgi:hypothetical protein
MHRNLARLAPLLLAPTLAACADDILLVGAFDGPDATAVLPVGAESPFSIPVGFVANTRNGRIVPLDLKHGTLLGDSVASPYLAPRSIATGDQRQLGQIALWSPDGAQIDVFAGDIAAGTLLQATYSQSIDPTSGAPVPPDLVATEAVFEDIDGSGDSVTVKDTRMRHGWSTTEDWIFEFDGAFWWAFGGQSGKQSQPFEMGERWSSDNKEIVLTLQGSATEGDRLTFRTDAGVREHDVGGVPLAVTRIPDTDLVALGTWDRDADVGALVLWDAAAAAEVGRLSLDAGGQPWRIVVSEEQDALFIADAKVPRVLRVPFDATRPDLLVAESIPTRSVPMDLALISDPGDEATGALPYDHLFVAGAIEARVDVYDLTTGTWLDVNPLDDVDGGLDLRSPVVGMSTAPLPIRLQEQSGDEVRREARVVAVTTFDGSVRLLEGATGCQAITTDGPRVASETGYEEVAFDDNGPASNPVMLTDGATGRQVISDPCGGVLRTESWSVIFDGVEGNWIVEGSASGVQEARAWPDDRYVTDQGELSFIILAATAPATDGDTFSFTMEEGTLRLDEVLDSSGSAAPLELPARPLAFAIEAGPTGGGWNADRRQVHLLVPATNSDVVLRIRPQAWQAEFKYE